jgi:tRNA U34 5-carboxymethylaminomethyl modifying enzyme MnmG/GidA
MLSLSSYSQTDTTKITVLDTTKVTIPTRIARLVYQDLLRYDGAKLEIVELNKVIGLKDEQFNLFKQKDTLKDQKISNLELIITTKDQQFDLQRAKSESLLKELKGQRRKTFLYKIGSFVGVIATSMLLLK